MSDNQARGGPTLRIKLRAYGVLGPLWELQDGRHNVADRLYLQVRGESRSWVFVYSSPAHVRQSRGGERFLPQIRIMGLGKLTANRTAKAEKAQIEAKNAEAEKFRQMLREGKDPLDVIHAERTEQRRMAMQRRNDQTFIQATDAYMAANSWKTPRYELDWRNSLKRYAFPLIGKKTVRSITPADVLAVLTPIWKERTITASRVRQRIGAVLDHAEDHGWRDEGSANPVRRARMPKVSKIHTVKHLPALPYAELPLFVAELREREGVAARMLEFVILTSCRSGEARGMLRSELVDDTWKIPPERTKTSKAHCIPLSQAAQALLRDLPIGAYQDGSVSPYVFANPRTGEPHSPMAMISVLDAIRVNRDFVVHSMRSCFRDWAFETTEHSREIIELSLGHAVGQVERAYRRGEALARRQRLMEDWANFLDSGMPFEQAAGRRLAARQAEAEAAARAQAQARLVAAQAEAEAAQAVLSGLDANQPVSRTATG